MRVGRGALTAVRWALVPALLAGGLGAQARAQSSRPPRDPLAWPAITSGQRPWTRWWWPGSSVDEANLTRSLEAYRAAGLGGVEITPIYGVAGYEDRFIPYLSPAWTERLRYTLREARRLGLGVDMATGTGWPWGGPDVPADDAARDVVIDTFRLSGGQRLTRPVAHTQEPMARAIGNHLPAVFDSNATQRAGRQRIRSEDLKEPLADNAHLQALALEQVRFPKPMPLVALVAYAHAGEVQVLTSRVHEGVLDWTAPPGDWTLYALFQGWHGKLVERAAPGGEGFVLDHFSGRAIASYLGRMTARLQGADAGVRAFFNDSYEVDDAQGQADWTPALLEEFRARRGYDLLAHLPALFGRADSAESARVLTDYRATISDLLLDRLTRPWAVWAASGHHALTRDQAHGSPGNILDLYAASGIPETEGTEILRFKFATSAAHVAGKPLASAEAATWLNEHFLSSLSDVKQAVDRYLLGGVNQIVYHGTAYSPAQAPWPGWLFYASVEFSPANPLWRDFGALNAYVARAQSILQGGRPDNDILLYLPISDRYARRTSDPGRPAGSLLVHFDGIEPFAGMPVADDATRLQARGFAFDFISDRQLLGVQAGGGRLRTGGSTYAVVLVPGAKLMPAATLEKLVSLAAEGATIIVHGQLPQDVPGLGQLAARQAALRAALARLSFGPPAGAGVRSAAVGAGRVLLGTDLEALLARAAVRREPLVDAGLQVVRRARTDGVDYFIVNASSRAQDGWLPLAARPAAAALFEPLTGRTGVAQVRRAGAHAEVYLQLRPGESIIVRAYDRAITGRAYPRYREGGAADTLRGRWRLNFMAGGPALPPPSEPERLGSWTELGEAARDFSGTARYSLTFPRPAGRAAWWRLSLGEVHESARVRLNGHELGTLLGPAFDLVLAGQQLQASNTLEIEVSNLMANRIAALDRRGEPWKRFYNVNFAARLRENAGAGGVFDASRWPPRPSGLLGPVTLTPLASF